MSVEAHTKQMLFNDTYLVAAAYTLLAAIWTYVLMVAILHLANPQANIGREIWDQIR
jgi:hypothetical protein